MASKILKMGSRVIFWVGEPPQKFFSKSEGVGEIMLFYFNFDLKFQVLVKMLRHCHLFPLLAEFIGLGNVHIL